MMKLMIHVILNLLIMVAMTSYQLNNSNKIRTDFLSLPSPGYRMSLGKYAKVPDGDTIASTVLEELVNGQAISSSKCWAY